MVSASYSLVSEGLDLENDALVLFGYTISQMLRTSVGVVGGMIFVALCQKYLEDHDNLAFGTVHGLQVISFEFQSQSDPSQSFTSLTTPAGGQNSADGGGDDVAFLR